MTQDTGGLPARRTALAALHGVFLGRRGIDEAFAQAPGFGALDPRDRGFAWLLASVVLKRAPEMDAALAGMLHEPLATLKPFSLLNVFRLGIAQMAFLGTPPHAAVDTTVELAAAEGIAHHRPLVNAVMRRLAREGFPHVSPRDAGKLNTPDWLWDQWMEDYGVETALDIAAANLGEAPVDFTARENPGDWAEKLEARLLPTGSLRRVAGGFVPGLPGFDAGAWWVQNAAAALPARLFGDLRGKTVVDLCAAPGGKTAQMACAGATVIAVDRSAARMRRLEENMARLKLSVQAEIADGTVWRPPAPVDAVLLDAPCTATGTIRHQPDVLRLKEPKDQEKMTALQRNLMLNAAGMLKPGGRLVYCTCSLQKAEGEHQSEWLLKQGAGLRRLSAALPGLDPAMLTPAGDLRCLPQHWGEAGGMDGFYVAVFERNK